MAEDNEKRRPGRPKTSNPATQRLPVVRVTPAKLAEYRQVATEMGVSVSEWIRVSLDAACDDDREIFLDKRRVSRINNLEIGQYYQFKIPGNYKTLGYVLSTSGDYVEFRPHKSRTSISENQQRIGIRSQRVHKNQIIDVAPASKQMLESAEDTRLY